MKKGLDISIRECLASGYIIMDYKHRELFPNGRSNGIDKDCYVNIKASWGHISHTQDGYPVKVGMGGDELYSLDENVNYNELLEIYGEIKGEIDSFTGLSGREEICPNEYDLLNLASDLHAYVGLNR